MSIKSHLLQAAFARRRELEHMRVERTEAVSRYYDHWGKVTTRYQNWTTPEYYKQAEDQVRQKREKQEKDKRLSERQDKLREIFTAERGIYEEEQRERQRPRSRKQPVDNEMLHKINQNMRERENIKRKLDLEAKLYGKWRNGVKDENAIFDSRSEHEVLAKLNWLDKQVDEQLQRERDEALAEEHKLQLQQEITKTEEVQKQRQQIRKQEIKEIRALQESHMEQLKQRQEETDELKQQEKQIRSCQDEMAKELELLEESSAMALEPSELSQAYNLNKIKVFIRKRSELFRNQLQLALSILQRLDAYCSKKSLVQELQQKYKDQLEIEALALAQIDAMYESEAKFSLQRCEEQWQAAQLQRYHELKQLLKDEQCTFATLLHLNLERQTEVVELRSTHLSSIENSNEKLKQLIKEEEDSPRGHIAELAKAGAAPVASPRVADNVSLARSTTQMPKLTNSFTNLNLDVWQDLPSARGGIDSPRLQSQRSLQVVTPDKAERPKYGRKRVAWT